MRNLTSALLVLSLLAPSVPVVAADTGLPSELPCQGTSDRARARCITDALKSWKELEHDYDEDEDARIAAWKQEHAWMGVSNEYQKMLRDFLDQVKKDRQELRAQLQAFRKAFFNEQKNVRTSSSSSTSSKPTAKTPTMTMAEAKAKCGPEDDDGLYRTCVRQLMRGVPSSVTKRSRSTNALIGK